MATTITQRIVRENVTVQFAPSPSTLQQSGALVSVGGTTLTVGSYQFFSSLSAVQGVLSTAGNFTEVGNMATTFFAQGNAIGVYVLELGVIAAPTDGPPELQTWITGNPGIFYAYLTPADWDGTAMDTLAGNNSSDTAKTYFIQSTTSSTISAYSVNKALITFAPAPSAASSEFGASAILYNLLVNQPSTANPLAPLSYRYVYGVTPWPQTGSNTDIDILLTANGNLFMTGAEGGLSNVSLFKGLTMDGIQISNWYGVDWFQIQSHELLANAVINGSNEIPPLLYDQNGINRLEAVAQDVLDSAVSFGTLQSGTVTATPFNTYIKNNPSDYQAGNYNGLLASVTAQNGFLTITFNITVSEF